MPLITQDRTQPTNIAITHSLLAKIDQIIREEQGKRPIGCGPVSRSEVVRMLLEEAIAGRN